MAGWQGWRTSTIPRVLCIVEAFDCGGELFGGGRRRKCGRLPAMKRIRDDDLLQRE